MYVVNVDGEKIRLGEQQKDILAFYIQLRDHFSPPQCTIRSKYKRSSGGCWGTTYIPTLWVRNSLFYCDPSRIPYELREFSQGRVTPSEKASFSRSLRQLEAKGLVECRNHVDDEKNYTTHYKITAKGEKVLEQVNFSHNSQKLTCQTEGV